MSRIGAIVKEIKPTQDYICKRDHSQWRLAHQAAISLSRPCRKPLYDIYEFTTDIDALSTGIIERTVLEIMQKKFRLVDAGGKENEKLTNMFEATWFKDFMRYGVGSRYWGHSLVELGNIITLDGVMAFDGVTLVPRRHVIPELGVVVRNVSDDYKSGIPYTDNVWEVESGRKNDLGIFLKTTPHVISKKHCQIFWDDLGERFGIPIIYATTTTQNSLDIDRLEGALSGGGANQWGILPTGTTLQIVETAKGDVFQVFDKRIERANKEISIALAGQTMVFEDGSSRAQGEVHERGFEKIVWQMADELKDTVNNRLLPRMAILGFPVGGYRFDWNDSYDYSPEEMYKVEQMLITGGFEIDTKYFIDKYGIPIIGRNTQQLPTDDKTKLSATSANQPPTATSANQPPSAKSFFD